MRADPDLTIAERRRLFGRRAVSFLLALAVEALVVLALLYLSAPQLLKREDKSEPTTFQMLPEAEKAAAKTTPEKKAQTKPKTDSGAVRTVPKPVLPPTPVPMKMIELTREDFAAADIAKMPNRRDDSGSDSDAGAGKDSVAAYGPGEGPGGGTMYNAEWYREPTRAELAGYMPANLQGGSAIIACKTAEKFRVENCRSLGEDPPGSGMARALRLASWQFLVRPPRVNGKPLIGVWVRIRYDLIVREAE